MSSDQLRYRTGRTVGRTIYEVQSDGSEQCVGLLDTPELAQAFVDAVNARAAAMEGMTGWFLTNDELVRRERAAYAEGRQAGRIDAAAEVRRATFKIEEAAVSDAS